ncbi:IS3 family transposase [Anaerobacillus isosaccharinicus]|uniref:IS3 family transposase n=2 Tax=Anaerobacillus isosaccharinicus TaxID=1532552 RepID=A0A7S7LCH7_9BACI|nr:IS3 family transposase [Anaerobacillus isosaccharinicus]
MEAHKNEHAVSKMCKVLGVSTSGYYVYLRRLRREETEREKMNRYIDERIKFHFHDNLGTYGAPRIHRKLIKEKIIVSNKKVSNRMRDLELRATPLPKYCQTTDSDHDKEVRKNVLKRNFLPCAPNKVWGTDITYIHTGEGFIYFNPIMDLYSRRIISYAIDDSMDHTLPLRALKTAIKLRQPGEGWIHHSDRGSQYCANNYIEKLEEAKATISMSRKANPYDNACVESFFASMKKEYIYKFAFQTKAEAIAAVKFYIEFYNRKRMHSTLDYATPIEYEEAYYEAQKEDATAHINTSA